MQDCGIYKPVEVSNYASNLILNANDSPVQPAFDPYWDKPMSRREAHRLFMKLASNDSELTGMADTAALLLNFILKRN